MKSGLVLSRESPLIPSQNDKAMQKDGPLILTKLRLPYIRPGLVTRPRLQEQIAQGLRGPLTLVTAPAGFGKTTLVASSIAACGIPVAWLSLDKNDNQAGRFLEYLIAALQAADQRIGMEAAQLVAGIQPALSEAVLTSLINDLERGNTEIALVLDDYQLISSQAVHDEVAFLLEHLPAALHLIILTRSDPPLPLSRLRARGQTIELRAADLRFTGQEAAQFLNDVMGLHLDAGLVAALEERTEGWIAGLQLAALSMRDRNDIPGFIEGFSGTNRYILDYLLEEVLACQPPEIQHFLLRTSILERLTTPLCDALLAGDEMYHRGPPSLRQSASVLEYLERENLFLVSLDDGCVWFRYHHLFADLLKARLQQTQPEIVPHLHIRAAAWLEQNGFINEAIQHLFEASEIGRAADLIERYGPGRWAESDLTVIQMAEDLPRETVLARPKIGLYLAWFFIIQSRIAKAIPLLNDLAREFAGAAPASGQKWMQTFVTSAQVFLNPLSSPHGTNPLPDYQLLEETPAEEKILRNAADYLYGLALARRDELERAVEVAVRCIQREKADLGSLVIPTLAPLLSRIYLIQGRLHATASLCREYLDPIQEKGIRFVYTGGSMKIDLGEALFEWNYLEEAEQYIRDGLQDNEPWQNIMTDGFGLVALARVLQSKGDHVGAIQVVEKFETRLLEHSQPREFDEDLRTLRIRVQLAGGDLHSASRWAEEIYLSEDYRFHEEYYRHTLALVRLAQGRYADVEKLLAGRPPALSVGSLISRQLESILLLAAAIARQRRLPEALGLVESCLALAEPEGYIRVFLNAGEPARELLTAYLQTPEHGHKPYAQRLLEAFTPLKVGDPIPSQPAGLAEPLSERELEVLRLIALGKTNQEIAHQLVVARGTIKAHAASIYRKLDVANRTEAVAQARKLGLLQ